MQRLARVRIAGGAAKVEEMPVQKGEQVGG